MLHACTNIQKNTVIARTRVVLWGGMGWGLHAPVVSCGHLQGNRGEVLDVAHGFELVVGAHVANGVAQSIDGTQDVRGIGIACDVFGVVLLQEELHVARRDLGSVLVCNKTAPNLHQQLWIRLANLDDGLLRCVNVDVIWKHRLDVFEELCKVIVEYLDEIDAAAAHIDRGCCQKKDRGKRTKDLGNALKVSARWMEILVCRRTFV